MYKVDDINRQYIGEMSRYMRGGNTIEKRVAELKQE
jgi:hypothetical protein